jgi:2-hydroxychromene-2-carboxylate isomerase
MAWTNVAPFRCIARDAVGHLGRWSDAAPDHPQVLGGRVVLASMGELISLRDHQRNRAPFGASRRTGRRPAVAFHFDLASPFTYLAAERIDVLLPHADWRPTIADAMHGGWPLADEGRRQELEAQAEARARELRLPISWPDRWPVSPRAAMRAASFAQEIGRAAPFVLAAGRLAYCGGYDLEDPEILAEAIAAAGLPLDDALAAARDESRDGAMIDAGRRLMRAGARRMPVVRVGRAIFAGEDRLALAVAAMRHPGAAMTFHTAG